MPVPLTGTRRMAQRMVVRPRVPESIIYLIGKHLIGEMERGRTQTLAVGTCLDPGVDTDRNFTAHLDDSSLYNPPALKAVSRLTKIQGQRRSIFREW